MQIMDLKRLKIKRGIVRTVTTKLTQKIVDELDEEQCFKRLAQKLKAASPDRVSIGLDLGLLE